MIKLLRFKVFVKSNIQIILLSLTISTFFLKENFNSLFFIAFSLYWLVAKKYKTLRKLDISSIKYYFIIVVLYLTLIAIGTFYSGNVDKSIDFFLKQLMILIIPILVLGIKWDSEQKKIFNGIFLSFVFLFVLYLYINVAFEAIQLNSLYLVDPDHPTWKYYLFTSGRLSPEVHPTYLSIFIVYNIFSIISFLKIKTNIPHIFYYAILILFIITLLLLSSRGTLFSILLVFLAYEIYKIIFEKNKSSFIKIILVALIILAVFSNTSVFHRISKLKYIFDKDLIEIAPINNSSGKRSQIYLIADKVVKDHFWFGIGTRNWEIEKEKYYKEYFSDNFEYNIRKLNTHNQYLNALISWGIIGPLLLIILMIFHISISFKVRDIELGLFWCFFSLVLLTENVLDRHRGIIFFSIISAYTIGLYIKKKEKI